MKMQYTLAVVEKWNLKESKNEMGNYVYPRPSTKERSYEKKGCFFTWHCFLMTTFAAFFFYKTAGLFCIGTTFK